MYMVLALNFSEIMQACRQDYKPFEGEVPAGRSPRSLIAAIMAAKEDDRRPVIAEIKPSSPTEGKIRPAADPGRLAADFAAAGACGISVLTEPRHFGGSLGHLVRAARAPVPVLRKDFLFDEAQIRESLYYGADTALLISSFFDADGLARMIREARRHGMEPLVEVHDRADIERAAACSARLYAINNRDRHTLRVDRGRTAALARHVDGMTVSASGIGTIAELDEALEHCDAALIGTALMKAADPGAALQRLVYGDRDD